MVVATSISLRTTADSRIEKKFKKKNKKKKKKKKKKKEEILYLI